MVLSSSLNERPSLSSMSYSIDPHTTTAPRITSLVTMVLSSSLNERPSLSSMSYSIDPHTTTGPASSLSSMAKLVPNADAKISLVETPYNVLAQTNASGFFIAFNVCADDSQELLIGREGFVPVKIKATLMTSTNSEHEG
ncbi:hypothetical protein OS493_038672 [Desmophyllum pertusum]|uniref:Uncharacterized protein n=1 Tax=Desmophyllum pertusum TaxID=174260 RepID=A0A9X0CVH8_9CNID|nr:hypothetical protein OS493_038672 [Desmophyllum pertusum]